MAAEIHYPRWADEALPDADRLVAFQRWLATMLQELLVWPADHDTQTRQIGQCRSFIERAVADLDKHGFLFRPEQLAQLVTDQLERIASYQRDPGIRDIYKYLEQAWDGWVGRQAEELAQSARMQGCHRSHLTEELAPSMPEIVRRNLVARDEEIRSLRQLRSHARAARKPCNRPAGPFLPGFG